MSAARAVAAKAHMPVQAAPPALQAIAPRALAAMAPMASLTAIPSGPFVQRKCAACEEEQTSVQPRLEVGPVGDRYEQEADSIAAQVMAMRDSEPSAASDAAPAVQRACAACSASSDDEPRARRMGGEDRASEEDELKVRALRDGGPETIAASDSELTSGGAALPASTRSFFETRMGRDLGDVRVHQGGPSAAMNASISARAFTYKNHVWLGAGETAGPSFTMAHELAHVMQQTAPGPVGPQRVMRTYFYEEVGKSLPDTHNEVVRELMSRDTSTFAEVPVPNANARGTAKTKKGFGRADLISFAGSSKEVPVGMATAPCPTAQQSNWYCGQSVDRSSNRKPTTLDVGREPIMHNGAVWQGMDDESLPRFGLVPGAVPKVGFIRDAGGQPKAAVPSDKNPSDSVPTEVNTTMAIGDVKAGAFPSARKKAVGQITEYMLGFSRTRAHYEDIRRSVEERRAKMRAEGRNDLSSLPPALTPWKVEAKILTKINKTNDIEKLRAGKTRITLRKWTSDGAGGIRQSDPVPGAPEVDGNLFLWREIRADMAGAWSYLWTPTTSEPSSLYNSLGPNNDFNALSADAFCLRDALSMPIDAKGAPFKANASKAPACLKPLRISASSPQIRRTPKGKAKPKKPDKTDQFSETFKIWTEKQAKIEQGYATYQKSSAGQARQTAIAELEARQNIADAMPSTIGAPRKANLISEKGSKALDENGKAQFWIEMLGGKSGKMLGQMRLRFGSVFLAVINGYQSAKAKISEFLAKMQPGRSSGGRIVKAALKVVGKVLAGIANIIIPRIGEAVVDCVETGVQRKIDEMFMDGPLAIVRERIEGAQEFATELTDGAIEKVKGLGDGLFGELAATIQKVRDTAALIAKIVGYAKEAFDLVRIAICVAGGVESFGLACAVSVVDKLLSLVDASPLELLADKILGTCYGQKLLGEAICGIDAVKSLPTTIAKSIIDKLRTILPPSMADLLCKPEDMVKGVDLPGLDQVTCGKGNSEALLGPSDANTYTKGDWVPPPGYPNARTRKKIEALNKKCAEAPESCAPASEPPPEDLTSPPPSSTSPAPESPPQQGIKEPAAVDVEGNKSKVPPTGEPGLPAQTEAKAPAGTESDAATGSAEAPDEITEGHVKDAKPTTINLVIYGGFDDKIVYDGTQLRGAYLAGTDSDGTVYGPLVVDIYVYKLIMEKPGWRIAFKFKLNDPKKNIVLIDGKTKTPFEIYESSKLFVTPWRSPDKRPDAGEPKK